MTAFLSQAMYVMLHRHMLVPVFVMCMLLTVSAAYVKGLQSSKHSSLCCSPASMLAAPQLSVLQVKDIVFLHKYNEPVLLILHEAAPTWVGRYRDCKDTMAVAALSINVVHKRHPRIWEASGLPSDTFKLISVPSGGAVALSQNMIMHFTQVGDGPACR